MNGLAIFGASGLIGRALTPALAADRRQYRIKAFGGSQRVDFDFGNVDYLRCDLLGGPIDPTLLEGIQTVICCAGAAGGRGQFKANAALMALDANVMNSRILKACLEASVKRIVLIASATMYPSLEGAMVEGDLSFSEDPPSAHCGLGWTWRSLEKQALWIAEQMDMEVVVLRTANIFGPFARFDPDCSNFIPALVRKAVDKMNPFRVYGSPSVTRDVLFVDDLVEAVMKLLDKKELGARVFNLGSGYPTRVGDVVDWSLAAAGHQPKDGILYEGDDYGPPVERYLDCRALGFFIDWQPSPSAEPGVRSLTEWWSANRSSWNR